MQDDKVVSIAEAKRSDTSCISVVRKQQPKPECPHRLIYILELERDLECRTCGQRIDPHKWLWNLGDEEQQRRLEIFQLMDEKSQLLKDIAALREEAEDLKHQQDGRR